MSYCRFSDISDIYAYENVYGGYTIVTRSASSQYETRKEFLLAVLEHLEAGRLVPVSAIIDIVKDLDQPENLYDGEFI